jgi:hypothetical protein
MTVMQDAAETGRRDAPVLDTHAASWFLQSQASWLVHGLDRADDATAVAIVLGRHEAGHGTWLALIADIERIDAALSEELSSLYAFHGRVVGSLERGPDPRLCREVHLQVRRLLRRRLLALTAGSVERLCGLGEGLGPTSATA